MHEFSNMPDERQANLFDRLIDRAGFQPKHLTQICNVPRSTAYRMVGGESPFSMSLAYDLIAHHPNPRVGQELIYALTDGSPYQVIVLDDHADSPVDTEIAASLRDVADLIEMRAEHKADGIITEAERDEEVRKIKNAANILHRALVAAASQDVTSRRKARGNLHLSGRPA